MTAWAANGPAYQGPFACQAPAVAVFDTAADSVTITTAFAGLNACPGTTAEPGAALSGFTARATGYTVVVNLVRVGTFQDTAGSVETYTLA